MPHPIPVLPMPSSGQPTMRSGDDDDAEATTKANKWIAGTWSQGIDLSLYHRKGKFTAQEEKLVEDAITEYLAAQGYNREHDLLRILLGDDTSEAGHDETRVSDGANGGTRPKTRTSYKDKAKFVQAIARNTPGRRLTTVKSFIERKYAPNARKSPSIAQKKMQTLATDLIYQREINFPALQPSGCGGCDAESISGSLSDPTGPRPGYSDDSELVKVAMPPETSAEFDSREIMIDPVLLALDAPTPHNA
ncbi:hypothetical protein QFC20_007578 [Naganishia adeliensis]|uniref:Uncharacterized protein n=1 Tax=Naganishia adeliensis TaxID=92952 RepID=A0ACC2UXL3_9TREE|nr:hypothetical protein QFC20_007578 [Naganishia adeliensis]